MKTTKEIGEEFQKLCPAVSDPYLRENTEYFDYYFVSSGFTKQDEYFAITLYEHKDNPGVTKAEVTFTTENPYKIGGILKSIEPELKVSLQVKLPATYETVVI